MALSDLILTLGALVALAACRPPEMSLPLPTQPPSPTTLRVVMQVTSSPPAPSPDDASGQTDVPASAAGDQAASGTATPAPTPRPAPACPAETGPNLRYDLNAVADLRLNTVRATEVMRFRNETGASLDELALQVDANRQAGVFSLINLSLEDGGPVPAYTLTGPRLTVALPEPLGVNCSVGLRMDFVLAPMPIPATGFRGRSDHLGFSQRQLNLGRWFPTLTAHRPGEGWILHDAFGVGEHYVLPVADFNIEITVEGAETPEVAGPGAMTQVDGDTWRFRQANARDMAFSISERFQVASAQTESGVAVEVYYFDESVEGDGEPAGLHALDTGVGAMERYRALYGPMPYSRVVVVASDFPDGMEFSGLVFVSTNYFRAYNGSAAGWLTLITAHELSHQWWYALVGNDQALDPWLDEALATYSEILYIEAAHPELINWWWGFRVTSYNPQGELGAPIYQYQSLREYINVNYLRGVLMLQDLRTALGDEAFRAWLQAYARANAGRIASPKDLWDALPAGVDMEEVARIQAWYGLAP